MMLTKPSGIKRAALLAAAAAGLAGCGFRLEGAGTLPPGMAKTYIDAQDRSSEFFTSLRDALRVRGSQVLTSRDGADAVLSVLMDDAGQRVLSVTARNVPREYEVFYTVSVALSVGERKLIEPETMVATRVYAWNENEVLGKSAEEGILRQALADDLARRVMRRIVATGAGAAPPSSSASGSGASEGAASRSTRSESSSSAGPAADPGPSPSQSPPALPPASAPP
ncbi:MAG TPA: LPS assembly lipoprotein LptE [Gammaproteobacteria bacterium]|nr:LPS assembly lipoprotein LptE [Gammaproteobacteria bacterium]